MRTLAILFGCLLAVGCSDGASPSAYRDPLAANGPSNRCSLPAGCFDECFCAGESTDTCLAACGSNGGSASVAPPPSGTGGTTRTTGAMPAGGSAATTSMGAGGTAGDTGGPSSAGNPSAGIAGSGASGSAGGAPSEPVCAPALPDATNAEFSCSPSGDLACNNCSDCRQIIDGSAKKAASNCGVQCGGSRSCADSCLKTSTTLSAPCSVCLLDFFDCLIANCLANCLGTTPDACTQCARTHPATGTTCSAALEQCSGARAKS